MLATILLAVSLASGPADLAPAPGDGLGLSPLPVPPAKGADPMLPPPGYLLEDPSSGGEGSSGPGPLSFVSLVGAAVAAAAALQRTRRSRGELAATPPSEIDVIFLPGHGTQPGGSFGYLIGEMGLAPDQVHFFDWTDAHSSDDHKLASQRADIDDAAAALEATIDDTVASGRMIYLVGHSKGGATIAEMLAQWDRNPDQIRFEVVGAALLDPPIASGFHGELQSVGRFTDGVPDDGGYSTEDHFFFGLWSEDKRVDLGARSGVETMVIRNPHSAIANFGDAPEGLRVYDLDDGKPGFTTTPFDDPMGRVVERHNSMLHHPAVAACLVQELWQANACVWNQSEHKPSVPAATGRGGGGIELVV